MRYLLFTVTQNILEHFKRANYGGHIYKRLRAKTREHSTIDYFDTFQSFGSKQCTLQRLGGSVAFFAFQSSPVTYGATQWCVGKGRIHTSVCVSLVYLSSIKHKWCTDCVVRWPPTKPLFVSVIILYLLLLFPYSWGACLFSGPFQCLVLNHVDAAAAWQFNFTPEATWPQTATSADLNPKWTVFNSDEGCEQLRAL